MPSINKRGDTFRIMVSLGYGMDGRQIRKTTTYKPPAGVTEGKAEKLATAFAYEFEKQCMGMVNLNESIRFSELAEWYYENVAKFKLKKATFVNAQHALNRYVLPHIGNLKLKDISPARIDSMYAYLLKQGRMIHKYKLRDASLFPHGTREAVCLKAGMDSSTLRSALAGNTVLERTARKLAKALNMKLEEVFESQGEPGGLHPQSITSIRQVISPIFTSAVKKGIIHKNPVILSTSPRIPKKVPKYLNAEQAKDLLKVVPQISNEQLGRAISILLYTGMRIGELLALHWEDVNMDEGLISIKYTLHRINQVYSLSETKTNSSTRVISIPQQVLTILGEQKKWQEKRKTEVGLRWIDRGTVFTGMEGEYMSSTYANTAFQEFLLKQGFPKLHLHDLRHANASLLINMGVPVRIIADMLGHCDTRITENTYAHVFKESKAKASTAIGEALSFNR